MTYSSSKLSGYIPCVCVCETNTSLSFSSLSLKLLLLEEKKSLELFVFPSQWFGVCLCVQSPCSDLLAVVCNYLIVWTISYLWLAHTFNSWSTYSIKIKNYCVGKCVVKKSRFYFSNAILLISKPHLFIPILCFIINLILLIRNRLWSSTLYQSFIWKTTHINSIQQLA